MTDLETTLTLVGGFGFYLIIQAFKGIWRNSHDPDTQAENDEQARNIGLYDWNGNPTEDEYYVLVDLSEDGKQAL